MHKSEEGSEQHRSSAAAMVETILEIQYFGPWCVEEPFNFQRVLRVI